MAQDQLSQRLRHRHPPPERGTGPRRRERRPGAEGPRPAGRDVEQRRVRLQPPPRAGLLLAPDPLLQPLLQLRGRPRPVGEVQQLRDERLAVGRRETRPGEPVPEACGVQRLLHRFPEHLVVVRVDRVQCDPHQGRPDHRPPRERGVQLGRIEVGQPVPQGQVRRSGMLRLERHHTPHGLPGLPHLPAQQQLPSEGGPVELLRGDLHAPDSAVARPEAPVPRQWPGSHLAD